MNGMVWQAKGLVLTYPSRDEGTEAFTHMDFDISAGEFVGLKVLREAEKVHCFIVDRVA